VNVYFCINKNNKNNNNKQTKKQQTKKQQTNKQKRRRRGNWSPTENKKKKIFMSYVNNAGTNTNGKTGK